jgi:adenylosuccinate synthase
VRQAIVVAGLGFGDEGKGSMVDFLTRHYGGHLVVRYNGGPQAAHNVVTDGGLHHTFSQFGSGTLAGARTFLSKHMLIEPYSLGKEAAVLSEKGVQFPLSTLSIDPGCVVITPWHRLANQLRESARGADRHGSVGVGVGETRQDELEGYYLMAGCLDGGIKALRRIAAHKIEEMRPLASAAPGLFAAMQEVDIDSLWLDYRSILGGVEIIPWRGVALDTVIFEGAQGVLLDEAFGTAPYNTWTDCTFRNAERLLKDFDGPIERVGVLRTYSTRHGAGPFPTEDPAMDFPEVHNAPHPWMGCFRQGKFDPALADYALECSRPDVLAFTHLDRMPLPDWAADKPVKYLSSGPRPGDKRMDSRAGSAPVLRRRSEPGGVEQADTVAVKQPRSLFP